MREPYPGYLTDARCYFARVGVLAAVFFVLLVSFGCGAMAVQSDPLIEYRYSGAPKRDAKGQIIRRADVIAAFRRVHPCPSTMQFTGACPGWSIDHVCPLACGCVDAVWNLQWLPNTIKTTPTTGKDRWERKIYAATPPHPDTAACVNQVVPPP